MNEPKKQHYVPRAYLKFFAWEKRKVWDVYVFDKKRKEAYRADIRDVAFENNFYTIERLGSKKYAWEEYYAKQVEPLIGKTFIKLIQNSTNVFAKNNQVVIDEKIRAGLSLIIITQLLPTPKARSLHYEISSSFFPKALETIIKSMEPRINSEQRDYLHNLKLDNVFKELEMGVITAPDRIKQFTKVIYDRCWLVYRNDDFENNPFITSDHPVVEYNMVTSSSSLGENGIGNPQTIIHYPINPQLMLAIYDRHNFLFQYLTDMDGRLVFLDKNELNYIIKVNKIQYEQCSQHVYSKYPISASSLNLQTPNL